MKASELVDTISISDNANIVSFNTKEYVNIPLSDYDEMLCKLEKLEKENKALKNRCYAISKGSLCFFCPLECEHRSCDYRNKESEENND